MKYEKITEYIANKMVSIYSCGLSSNEDRIGAVYLNMYQDSSDGIIKALSNIDTPPFALIAISGLNWDDDMTPWPCPPISKGDTPCNGKADNYLAILTGKIIPHTESILGAPLWRGIAGYSLGGLFALYAPYKTDAFKRAASMSGSLWYPDWMEYAAGRGFMQKIDCVYLSLGDKECKTRNKYLKCVQEKTEEYFALLKTRGIETQFTLNPGNHFVDAAARTAAGIAWMAKYTS